MGNKIQDVIQVMEIIAPAALAEPWDNVGLLWGSPQAAVTRVMAALEVSSSVISEAAHTGAQLLIVHHPLIFKPLKTAAAVHYEGRLLQQLADAGIALFAAHTNLDKAPGGMDDALAKSLDLTDVQPLTEEPEVYYKLVVYIPSEYEDTLIEALAQAGAGEMGGYSHCTFRSPGIGTFMPGAGTNPFIGRPHQLESAAELRLETLVNGSRLSAAIEAMRKVHPYEVPAFDVLPLKNNFFRPKFGRIGRIAEPMAAKDFLNHAGKVLRADRLDTVGDLGKPVHCIATAAGAGGDCIEAAQRGGADLFITGEIKHHEALAAAEHSGTIVAAAGHFRTEMPGMEGLIDRLQNELNALQYTIEAVLSKNQGDPLCRYQG